MFCVLIKPFKYGTVLDHFTLSNTNHQMVLFFNGKRPISKNLLLIFKAKLTGLNSWVKLGGVYLINMLFLVCFILESNSRHQTSCESNT
jgi:hypothetical protein